MMYLLYVGRAALYDVLYGSSDVLYDIIYEGTDVLSRTCCLPCFPMFLGMQRGVDRGFRLRCPEAVEKNKHQAKMLRCRGRGGRCGVPYTNLVEAADEN